MLKKSFIFSALATVTLTASAQQIYLPLDGSISESISGNTASVSGVRTLPYQAGAKGTALRTDGYSNFVDMPLTYTSLNGNALTMSLWICPEAYPMMKNDVAEETPTYALIAGNYDTDKSTGFGILLSSQGKVKFCIYDTNEYSYEAVSQTAIPVGVWTHVTGIFDANSSETNKKLLLYIDGNPASDSDSKHRRCETLNPGTSHFRIAKDATNSQAYGMNLNAFSGLIDDIKVWNTNMSADEVKAEYSSFGSVTDPDMSIDWNQIGDVLRPKFHGMPAHNWTNESHGLTYSDGKYHLFFQKNGDGPWMSRLNWGHISSTDLLNWKEERAAIVPGIDASGLSTSYDTKGCWSGCVFTDGQITGGTPYIIYTGVDNAKATIDMASPTDASLLTWNKYASNPVINGRPSGLSDDFRDPYFFRTNEGAFIIVGSSKNGIGTCTLHKYNASSSTWSNDGSLFYTGTNANACGTFWEMPTVTKMGDKYLFTCTPQNTASGVRTIYYTGSIDANGQFTPDNATPQIVELSGFARDGYGMLSPTIYQTADGKTIALGIVPDKLPTEDNYSMGYAHTYSLPREWSLATDGSLIQKPYSGLKTLRTDEGKAAGRQVEVEMSFTVGTGKVGTYLLKNGDKSAKVYYNPSDNTINVDLSTLDRKVNDNGVFNGIYSSFLPRTIMTGETMKLDVYLDGSVLDIFINDTWASSVRVFATDAAATGVEVLADNASDVTSYNTWNLSANATDAISEVSADECNISGNTTIYNLSGVQLSTPQRGINIIGNRKYIIK